MKIGRKFVFLIMGLLLSITIFLPLSLVNVSAKAINETGTLLENNSEKSYELSCEGNVFNTIAEDIHTDCKGIVDVEEPEEDDDDIPVIAEDACDANISVNDNVEGCSVNAVARSSTQATIYGTYEWEDENGVLHPLRFILIELYIGGKKSDSTYTSSTGYYSFTFDVSGEQSCYLYARSEGDKVLVRKNTITGSSYICKSETITVIAGYSYPFYRYIPHDSAGQKALIVAQALVYGTKYVEEMGYTAPSTICHYPKSSNQFSSFWNVVDITETACDYWDIILHEYGHKLQHYYDIENSPGGSHVINSDLIDIHGKDKGLRLAWGEGWPTFFGILVTQYYGSWMNNVPRVNDNRYNSYSTDSSGSLREWNSSLESPGIALGEGCEMSIFAALYDFYDASSSLEPWDELSLSHSVLFDAVVTSHAHTFSEFITYFYDNYYSPNDGKLGAILTRHGFTSTNLRVASSLTYDKMPTFTWNAGGPSSNTFNSFSLIFYNQLNTKLLTTEEQTDTSYTLTADQWVKILSTKYDTFSVVIVSKQTDKPSTGEYYSTKFEFTKPEVENLVKTAYFPSSTRYFERKITLSAGQYCDYDITFSSSGYKIFQTFGTKDTKLELYSESGTLLASNDDGGYSLNAYICYNTNANATYKVRVKFYSSVQYGTTKLVVMPSTYSYSSYNNIFVGPENWSSHSGTISGGGALLCYNAKASKTVTFTMNASFDTYLYVIDPRSTDLISSNANAASVYNDDGAGNLQAKITKTLDANVPYLIIASAFNPSSQSGSYTLSFS